MTSSRSTPTVSSRLATTLAEIDTRIEPAQQFHQVLVRRRKRRLDDEDVARAHVLLDLDRHLAVGEASDRGLAQVDAQALGDLERQRRIGVAGEQHGVEQHARSSVQEGRRDEAEVWQGRKDSNPRMSESK